MSKYLTAQKWEVPGILNMTNVRLQYDVNHKVLSNDYLFRKCAGGIALGIRINNNGF